MALCPSCPEPKKALAQLAALVKFGSGLTLGRGVLHVMERDVPELQCLSVTRYSMPCWIVATGSVSLG